jgi:hypothetical protein
MNEDYAPLYITILFAILIIGGGLFFATLSAEQESIWATKCEMIGGVPSKYRTMVGKTSHEERLCIKKENILEVGE